MILLFLMQLMCKQVAKLQRASLHDPVKVEVSNKYQTVDKLLQFYLFIPAREKVLLFYLDTSDFSYHFAVFCALRFRLVRAVKQQEWHVTVNGLQQLP